MFTVSYDAPLMHHGVKGMHWGVRRYQNRDGSLTSAGRNRYDSSNERGGLSKRAMRKAERQKRRLAEQQALEKWFSGKKLSYAEKAVLLGKKNPSEKEIADLDKYTSGKIHQKTVNDYNRSKLAAAQKAERKRKLIKGAKIAAAALGTAADVGGSAYAMKKISALERAMANQDRARRERNARNEQIMRRQAEENARRTQFRNARLANERLRTEQDVDDYFQGTGRAGKFDTPEHNRRMRELEDTYVYGNFTRHRTPTAEEIARSRATDERDKAERMARSREYTTPSNTSPYHNIGAMWDHGAEEQYRRDHRR